jgi:hypothetical protein
LTALSRERMRNAGVPTAIVTCRQVWTAVEAEAEEDPEFLASLTEGQSSQSDVRQRLARRLGVDEASLEPFKETIMAKMLDLWTAPDAEPEAFDVYEAGPWEDAKSRAEAGRKTGVDRVDRVLLEDGVRVVGVSEPVRGARGVWFGV